MNYLDNLLKIKKFFDLFNTSRDKSKEFFNAGTLRIMKNVEQNKKFAI